jgi:hypothetical protein
VVLDFRQGGFQVVLQRPKTLAVLQPGYLPWLGFFDQMRRSDVFVIYDDVQFDKHGWRNRNRIKGPAGPHWLTVPVLHSNKGKPSNREIQIDSRTPWQRKHLGTIEQYYRKAPCLDMFLEEIREVFSHDYERLLDLDMSWIKLFCKWLAIDTQIEFSSTLGITGEKSSRLVRICEHFGAKNYLTGNAASDYLDVGLFEASKITVEWQDFVHPVYPQLHGEFVPYLSTLDLILNCGHDSRDFLTNKDTK